ncbi:MAG: hypothetical protein RJB11_2049 [Planctomycetota bacterium]
MPEIRHNSGMEHSIGATNNRFPCQPKTTKPSHVWIVASVGMSSLGIARVKLPRFRHRGSFVAHWQFWTQVTDFGIDENMYN